MMNVSLLDGFDGHLQLMAVLWIKGSFFYTCYVYALNIVDYFIYDFMQKDDMGA